MLRIIFIWALILGLFGAVWADGSGVSTVTALRSEITLREGQATFTARPRFAASREAAVWFVAVPAGSTSRVSDENQQFKYYTARIRPEVDNRSVGNLTSLSVAWLILGVIGLLRTDRRRPVATMIAAGFLALVLGAILFPVNAIKGGVPNFDPATVPTGVAREFRTFTPADRTEVLAWAASNGVDLPSACLANIDAAFQRKDHLVAWVVPANEGTPRQVLGPVITLPKSVVSLPDQFGSTASQTFTHQVLVDSEKPTVVDGLITVQNFRFRQTPPKVDSSVRSLSLADEGYAKQARSITSTDHPIRTTVIRERLLRTNQVQLALLGGAAFAFLFGFGLGSTPIPRPKKLAIWAAGILVGAGLVYFLNEPRGIPIGSEWRLINSRPDRLPPA